MQNKNQNTNVVFPATDANDASGVAGFAQSNLSQPLSLDQPINTPQSPYTQQVVPVAKQEKLFVRLAKRADVILAVLLILGSGGLVLSSSVGKEPTSQSVASRFETTQLPLSEFVATSEGLTFGTQSVIINGSLQVKDGLIIAPTVQPTTAVAGQMYYDQTSNILSYYNGSEFVSLSAASGVQSLGGVSGSITVGDGLSVTAGQLANTGVLTVQGQTGNVTFTGGNGIAINGTTISNTGITDVVSSTSALTVTKDASGKVTLSGNGAGTVSSSGGTAGRIPLFTTSQNIENSNITQSGSTITVTGDLAVTSSLSLGSALSVSNGGTGATTLTSNGVLIGQGTGAISSVTAGGSGLCLISTAGAPAFSACPGGGGVTSLDGLTGALTLANSTGSGTTVTIDNASTSAKGIAQFSSANFSVASGVVNTIQDINSSATPTFVGVNTNNITPNAGLTVGSTSQTVTLQGSTSTITSTGAGNDITLNSADTIELQDNTNIGGNLDISGTLTAGTTNAFQVGATGNIVTAGNITLQGGTNTIGTTSQQGSLVLHDGNGQTATISVGSALVANTAIAIPTGVSTADTFCLLTLANCVGSGGSVAGSGTNNQLAKFTSTGSTIGDSTITDDGTTVTTTVDMTIQGGDLTVGTSGQLASFILHDGGGQTATLRAGDSSGNLTFILPTTTGTANQCLKQSGTGNQLTWDDCDGGGGGTSTTLQEAYDNGNTITTDASGNISFTLNNQDFAVQTAAGATGSTSFSLVNGSNATPASQLVLISNNDIDQVVANGLTISSAAGGITDGLDVSDAELVNAINLGQNDILSDGVTISTAELNLLNGHDVALVDTNDAVSTAITGTGALISGSIGSGFGTISTGNTIVTTSSMQGSSATFTGATSLTLGTASSNTGTIAFKGSGGTGTLILSGPTTPNAGNFTLSLPAITADASVCTTNSVCSGYQAAGSYANTSLSNLSSVAINTSLLAGATTIDLGSGSAPFRDLYLGGTATNNFRFTGTAGAARTITLDDLSGRLALVQTAGGSTAQTGDLNVSGTLIAGTALQGTLVGSASSAGASSAVTFRSGDTTGGSGLSTGAVTLKSGDGSGTNTSSGNITIDTGSVTGSGTAGTITLGGTNASALTLGRSGLTTSNAGALTVAQQLTANGGISVAANQNLTLQNGTGVFGQTYTTSSASSAQTLSVTNSNSGGSSIAVNGHQITLVGTATSGGTNSNSAFSFVNPSAAANNNFYGLNFAGTGYTDILRVNGTQIINGSGVLQNAGLGSGVNYTNITQVGTLTSGALGAGFTTIAVGQGGTGATSFTSNGILYGNSTGALQVTAAGTNGQCLVGNTGSAPSWVTCTGLVTLQNAYANGNTISTTGNDISFTLNTSQSFTVATAAGATGSTAFSLVDGSNTSPPSQLVLVTNNDTDQALANGITISAAAGGITDGLDVSDAELDNALNIGANAIAGTNFAVTAAGAVTAVGVNAGSGQIQGTGGLSVTGTTSLNTTGTANTSIGNATGTFELNSNTLDISTGGALTGITGLTMASGNFLQTGTGTFGTGSGAVSLNGDTTVAATKTLTVTSGLTSLTGNTSGDALNVSNSTSTGNIAVFSDNSTAVLTLANGGGALFRNQTNSATALQVQNATGADTLFTIDTAARSASGGNLVKIGNSTGTDTDTTFLVLDGSTADPSTNIAALNGGMFYDSDDHKVKLIENGQVKIICNTTDLGCGTGTVTLQSAYGNGNTINTTDNRNIAFNLTDQSTDPSFLIDLQCDTSCSTNGKFAVQDDGSDVFTILPAAGGITVGDNTLNTPVTINSGTGTIAVGTGAQARTVNVATGAAVQTVTVGSTNSTSSLLLQAGTGNLQIQTQGGTLGVGNNSVAQTLQIGNTTGATAITIDAGTGTIAVGTGAQARTINVGTGAAAQTVTVGSTSGASALTLQSGTGNLSITTQGTGSLNIGNNAVAQTLNIGNGTGATAVSVLCGTGTCGFGNNAVAHTTTLGSTTGTATTNLQAGTGGLSLTSGANITLGTSNTTGTLLVLDDKTDSGDPTGVAGGMYYNSNLKVFRCYDTYWRDCMATVRTTYSYTMEMGSGTGDNTFTFDTSGGGTDDGVDGVTSHPSIMLMGTSTGATNWVYAGSRKSDAIRLGNGDYWRYETVFRIGTISDDTTDYFFRAGFGDNLVASDNGSNGCYFKYNDDVNGGDWQGICVSGGTANNTVCDTNVPVSASTWYRLTVAVNSAGNSVDFIIDGTSRCQVTTNIPTGSGNVVGWGDAIKKTTGSTDITADLDYITLEGQMGTSR